MSARTLEGIPAPSEVEEADLVAWLEGELDRRQEELVGAAGRVDACRQLLLEARRAATSIPGHTLTVGGFLPHGLDDVTAATRRYLLEQFQGDEPHDPTG
jgi:hypothetical protein